MNPVKLPFDQYQRYCIVKDAIEAVRGGGEPLKILDVGGSPGTLTDFMPSDDIYILDRVPSTKGRFIRGDGTALPFREKTFDIVISVDVLEHIVPDVRESFIKELKRVSRDYVFIAAPFKTHNVQEAEVILYDVIKAASGEEHAFLREHIKYGLPDEQGVTQTLAESGWQTLSVPNGVLKRWLPMMALSIYVTGDKFLKSLARRINTFYNENYYPSDNCEPSYRHLLASCRGGFREEVVLKIEGLGVAADGKKDLDLSWLSPLINLHGYNALRKAGDLEREEFKKVIETRDKNIKSLEDTLEAREGYIKGLKATVEQKDNRIQKLKARVEKKDERIAELVKRLDLLEKSRGVKALKGLGIIKQPK